MGPTLARLARNAAPDRRVVAVARFSEPGLADNLRRHGVETIACDLIDRDAVARLPRLPNVVFMAGRKFGAGTDEPLTWAMNVLVPGVVAELFGQSRIVAFSTGCVYPFVGNDDHIVLDLLSPFVVARDGEPVEVRLRGGLLGHWSVWVRSAVELFERCRAAQAKPGDRSLLALDSRVTDCNSALFDAPNGFAGCIAGCHEVLRRQGLLDGIWCLDPAEGLRDGQILEIDRICREHADLTDDAFVRQNLERWLA